ncbi:hypothetical protein J2Z22_002358 [Paenibacillus forsythiae]|uniref:Uncharacterized protein n=1 Tax=Paenibacillus forsythiae TaxID=365616 RepID=A0ABU3H7L1_9BACL|nr:hypothetical protein [Paenibacillus forsythiae]MDT3426824.1 hypothetical protein [Paenibacillus forsythiae]
MNRTWWIGAAMLLTAVSAALLPQIERLHSSPPGEHRTVETLSSAGEGIVLGDANLVDEVGGLPFSMSIGSVGWKDGVLSLDLKVTDSRLEPGEVYADMALAFSFAFRDTENVDQVMLRVIAEDKWLGTARLLLAADARRQELSGELLRELQTAGNLPLQGRLKAAFRVSETSLWKNQFIPPSSG